MTMATHGHASASTAAVATPGRWRTFIVTTLLVWMLSGLWSQATPLMSVTDEPSHAIRAAAAVRGQFVGTVGQDADIGRVEFQTPPGLADSYALTCTAWQVFTSAACQPDVPDAVEPLVTATSSAWLNLPTYYAIVGWPSLLLGGEAGMSAMRLWNALLFSALVGVAAMQLRMLPRHRWALTGLAVAALPTAIYIGGSLNPNGFEWAGSAAVFATLLALGRTTSTTRELWERGGLVVVSALLLVSARGVTPLWLLYAFLASLLAARSDILAGLLRRWQLWLAAGVAAIVMTLSAWWILRPPAYGVESVPSDGEGSTPLVGAQLAWERLPLHWDQLVNWYGWQDTEGPAFSRLVLLTALIAFTLVGVALARPRLRIGLVFLSTAFIVTPIALSAALIPDAGYIWLGRYMLAVVPLIAISAGVAIDDRGVGASAVGERLRWWLLAAIGAAQIVSFAYVLRRFAVGQDESIIAMLLRPEWQPPLLVIPSILLVALVVAACVAVVGRAQDEASASLLEDGARWPARATAAAPAGGDR